LSSEQPEAKRSPKVRGTAINKFADVLAILYSFEEKVMSVIWILIFTPYWGVKVQKKWWGLGEARRWTSKGKNNEMINTVFLPKIFSTPYELVKYPWVI
jgi:hypothetical protein